MALLTSDAITLRENEHFFRPFELCCLLSFVLSLRSKPIILLNIMRKRRKYFKSGDLIVDTLYYAFTEWLSRQGLLVAFKTNYDVIVSPYGGFRERLRDHIRHCLCSPNFDPTRLISTAFVFSMTPEGSDFWKKYSAAWERFYLRLQSHL